LPLSDDFVVIRQTDSGIWKAGHKVFPGFRGYGPTPGKARDDLLRIIATSSRQ
jgi:hypothetical protein